MRIMNVIADSRQGAGRFGPREVLAALLSVSILGIGAVNAVGKVALWDTTNPQSPSSDTQDRSTWKPVPNDLLQLESQPAKASSDPGYYGRDYSFKGDAVVENEKFVVAFCAAKGRVIIYPKTGTASPGGNSEKLAAGTAIAELRPLQADSSEVIKRVELIRNADDRVVLEAIFSAKGGSDAAVTFSFDQSEIIEVQPGQALKGMTIHTALAYGIAPSFIGDDLLFSPADYPSANQLFISADNFFLGLAAGENSELVMTWPAGKQQLQLHLARGPQPGIDSLDFENDGQSFYLAPLSAAGIWHQEALEASFLEKDTKLNWQKPFPARWKTQLYEEETKTTFAFRDGKGEIWRGVPGSYNYPVWFEGDDALCHFSKKVPPKGESVIYFLEGRDTPPAVSTPVDILNATLGRQFAGRILDLDGRKLRTHHRRGGDGVRRACTCGCTEAIQAVFENHEEAANKEYIQGALDDMVYFMHCHVDRINEYQRFTQSVTNYLQAQASSSPELKSYLGELGQIAARIADEYEVQKENMKSFQYADGLVQKTLALTQKANTNNLAAYMDLLKAWRGMGGSQDYVLAQCHTITRGLCQAAGYGCMSQPKAVAIAREVRERCRKVLRTPDGYEIWADY